MRFIIFFFLCASAFAEEMEICHLKGNGGSLYVMPRGEVARVLKGTVVLLVSAEGRKLCVLSHHIYPFVEKTEDGKFIATDLRNGQKVFRQDGDPFVVVIQEHKATE